MKPVEKYKDVPINGRNFRIKKFDARTGSFMLLKVTGLLAPLFKNLDIAKIINATEEKEDGEEAFNVTDIISKFNISGIMAELGNLSEEDFDYVQEKSLRVCSELLPAGEAPVLRKNGTFGVEDLADDTITVMALTAHALIFNLKGFFSGSPLASLLGGLPTTSRQS
ncbi:phage tail assembly chaperone [Paenibacillus filicis]|uniref:Phage tail assembly chaperone n=1 Tax=Paenibacillus filicis TaxID=669464 RepID=A0ABU9DIG8_9BACL